MSKTEKMHNFQSESNLLTKSQIATYAHNYGFGVSKKVYGKLNERLETLLEEGIERAKDNNRKTLMARDV